LKRKKKKRRWHDEHVPIVFEMTGGECKHCSIVCKTINLGAIHHTTYRPINGISIYDLSIERLFELEIIEWVCRECHRKIHETESIDGITKIRGVCFMCNSRYGHTERSKLLDIDKPMCKMCFRRLREIRKMRDNGQGTLF